MTTPITAGQIETAERLDKEATQGPLEVWQHEDEIGNLCWRLRAREFHQLAYVMSKREDAEKLAFFFSHGPQAFRELQAAREEIEKVNQFRERAVAKSLQEQGRIAELSDISAALRTKLAAARAAIEAIDQLIPKPSLPLTHQIKDITAAAIRELEGQG